MVRDGDVLRLRRVVAGNRTSLVLCFRVEKRKSKVRTGLNVCLEGEKERMKERMAGVGENVSVNSCGIKGRSFLLVAIQQRPARALSRLVSTTSLSSMFALTRSFFSFRPH